MNRILCQTHTLAGVMGRFSIRSLHAPVIMTRAMSSQAPDSATLHYVMGVAAAKQWNFLPKEHHESFLQGFNDMVQGKNLKEFDPEACNEGLTELMNHYEAKMKDDWLKSVEETPNMMKTESGLLYTKIQAGLGDGAKPGPTSKVTVNYKGSLHNGTVFDQSKEPVTFGVSDVIKGFSEGLQLMEKGDKFLLVIPSDLGYGPAGAGNAIPPNSHLLFEIELVSFE